MEYLKVMLVDDEDLVIEDIQALIDWENFFFSIVSRASDNVDRRLSGVT